MISLLFQRTLLEAHGAGRARNYALSAKVYRHAGQKAAYVRQAGFDPIQQEPMVLTFIDRHSAIKRADVMELCHLSKDQAHKLLTWLKRRGEIRLVGKQKGVVYERQH